jgi:hypothetical protein
VSAQQRFSMLGMESASVVGGSGFILTPRDHTCGDFKDGFDWSSLPPAYLKRIGYAHQSSTQTGTNPTTGHS